MTSVNITKHGKVNEQGLQSLVARTFYTVDTCTPRRGNLNPGATPHLQSRNLQPTTFLAPAADRIAGEGFAGYGESSHITEIALKSLDSGRVITSLLNIYPHEVQRPACLTKAPSFSASCFALREKGEVREGGEHKHERARE